MAMDNRCRVCSRPLISEKEICTRCRTRDFAFDANVSVFRYAGSLRTLLAAYKFGGRADLAPFFAASMAATLRAVDEPMLIVPVPARRRAARERSYDPVLLVARDLSRLTGLRCAELLRRRAGTSQKSLNYGARLTNLRGRILMRRGGFESTRLFANIGPQTRSLPRGVVLIDDVFTTGATAHECARVLKQNGARSVVVLTIAMD